MIGSEAGDDPRLPSDTYIISCGVFQMVSPVPRPIYILMAAGLLIFLITLYDAWNELARARKRCKHEQDI